MTSRPFFQPHFEPAVPFRLRVLGVEAEEVVIVEIGDDAADASREVVRVDDGEPARRFREDRESILCLPDVAVPGRNLSSRVAHAGIRNHRRRKTLERQILIRDVAARIDGIRGDVSAPHRLHHVEQRVVDKPRRRPFRHRCVSHAADEERRSVNGQITHGHGEPEHAGQVPRHVLGDQDERFAPPVVGGEQARRLLERAEQLHVGVEFLEPEFARRTRTPSRVRAHHRPANRPVPLEQRDRIQQPRSILGHLDGVLAARRDERHRGLRAEILDDLSGDLLDDGVTAPVGVQIVEDDDDEPLGSGSLVAGDVQLQCRREKGSRLGRVAVAPDFLERRDLLRLLAVEDDEVVGREAPDGPALTVAGDDVDLNQLDGRAKHRALLLARLRGERRCEHDERKTRQPGDRGRQVSNRMLRGRPMTPL